MINEDRIRLMTKLAVFEENDGKKALSTSRYYRKDYMSAQMIKAFLFGTISYVLVVISAVFIGLALKLTSTKLTIIPSLLVVLVIVYFVYIGIYMAIAYRIASRQYEKVKEGLKTYYSKLKKIEKFYDREEFFSGENEQW